MDNDNNKDMEMYDAPLYNRDNREEYEEPTVFDVVRDWIKGHMAITFVLIGVIIVGLILFFVPRIASSKNPIKTFVEASSNLVYKGGFDFKVSVNYDGQEYLKYNGSAEFDQGKQTIKAAYTGEYPEYTYSNYKYTCNDRKTYQGNYYNKKWTVVEDKHRVTDFYDFLRDYREGRFDANAYISYFNKTGVFVPTELNKCVNNVVSTLGAGSSSILHTQTEVRGDVTVYTFTPELDQLMDIVLENNSSAFNSAEVYSQYRMIMEQNKENFKDAKLTVEFMVDRKNVMTEFHSKLVTHGKEYTIDAIFTNVGTPDVKIPIEFFDKCNIDIEEVKDKYIAPTLEAEAESIAPAATKAKETEQEESNAIVTEEYQTQAPEQNEQQVIEAQTEAAEATEAPQTQAAVVTEPVQPQEDDDDDEPQEQPAESVQG